VIPTNNSIFNIVAANYVSFDGCEITATFPSQYNGGEVFRLDTCSYFEFTNSSVAATFAITAGVYVPGNIFTVTSTNNSVIRDSQFTGNFRSCVVLNYSNDFIISRCSITSSYDPQSDTSTYTAADLVNSGDGLIVGTDIFNLLFRQH